jgi:hypothetical protein
MDARILIALTNTIDDMGGPGLAAAEILAWALDEVEFDPEALVFLRNLLASRRCLATAGRVGEHYEAEIARTSVLDYRNIEALAVERLEGTLAIQGG